MEKRFETNDSVWIASAAMSYEIYHKKLNAGETIHFIKVNDGKDISFEDTPFLEITPTQRIMTTYNIKESGPSVTKKTESIETPISKFNKKELCDYIIDNGDLATQELLKLAVSYRFANDKYSGNGSGGSPNVRETADEEEFRMIKEIVKLIVKDYNMLRKELNLSYDDNELRNGIPRI